MAVEVTLQSLIESRGTEGVRKIKTYKVRW